MSLTSSSCNETSDEHLSNTVRINTNMSSLAAGNRILAGLTIPAVLGVETASPTKRVLKVKHLLLCTYLYWW